MIVTPAHQFPTGCVMSSERRAALIEWAETGDGLIVEDDFDAEFRYDRGGVGALQGLAPERVVLIGSASKRLAPAMRLGWMLAPSWLAWPLISAKAIEDSGSEAVGQLALHDFIDRGELDRHLRRMRLRYERRREALLEALARWAPGCVAGDGAAGLYELVELPPGVDEAALIAAAAERGVGVEGVSLHRFTAGGPPASSSASATFRSRRSSTGSGSWVRLFRRESAEYARCDEGSGDSRPDTRGMHLVRRGGARRCLAPSGRPWRLGEPGSRTGCDDASG